MKLSRKKLITKIRSLMTPAELLRPKNPLQPRTRIRTSVWDTEWYQTRKGKIAIRVRNRETVAKVKAEARKEAKRESANLSKSKTA